MKPGEVIHDRFVLERFIARGGMGEVYRALDNHTRKAVAIKVLSDDDEALAERLGIEARALMELNHPAIVRYVAHGNAPTVGVYLAMEWLEGSILPTRLKRQPLTLDESLAVCARIADGLGAAHQLGMVHRDVKPANLFLVEDRVDQVKVLDFGIVRSPWKQLTQTGHGLGTPEYMAPEQARCERTLGPPADVFALGCVLFRCLAGRPAFRGDAPGAVVAQIATLREAPRLSATMDLVPRLVDELVARMMAPAATERPSDGYAAAELIRAARSELRRNVESAQAWRTPTPSLTSIEQQPVALLFIDPDEATAATRPAISLAEAVAPTMAVSLRPSSGEPVIERDTDENAPPAALGLVRQAVEPFAARIEVLANGSILAMLSGGATAADLAVRAARCALAVHAVLPRVSIALVTRRAVADDLRGAVAVMDRPSGTSPSRRIRVDKGTRELLPEHFDVTGDEAEGFVLRAEKPPEGVPRRLLGHAMPYVGRQAVLRRLQAAVEGCTEERIAGAVVVVGEPGVGKSRLRAELLDRVRDARMAVLHGWCDPLRSGVPYGVLARALRTYLGIPGGPSPAQREALLARMESVPQADRHRVAEFLGQLVGISFGAEESPALRAARKDPELMAQQKASAWQDWLAAECAERPVMLVIDDLHAADAPSVGLVAAGLRRAADLPFFVLALARPEVHARFPRLGEEWARDEVRLEPLRAAACGELVRQVLGEGADEVVVNQLVERSAGNPFYLEELIRTAVAGEAGALPESVVASVQLRIGKLPVRARQVLRAASVFGKVFWAGGIAAMIGDELSESELDEWIEVLEREELIERRAAGRALAGEVELAFRHDLVRDAAYQMLIPGDRMVGHRLAGSWLQAHGETDALVLAEHFAGGGVTDQAVEWFARAAERALAGGEMADALRKAATYYRRAGETCAAAYANASAEEYLERAVALWSPLDPVEAARTRLDLAAWRAGTGERDRALDDLRLAEEALGEGQAEETRIEILLRRANLEMRAQGEGVLERARKTAEEALERARRAGSRELEARALILMAVALSRLEVEESSVQAIELVERALSLVDSPGAIGEGLWRLGNAFLMNNDLDRAASIYPEALASAEAAGDELLMGMCLSNLGMVSFRRWQLDQAIEQTRSARTLYERIGHRTRLLEMTNNLGTFLDYRGEPAAARPLLEEVLQSARGDWMLNTLSREVLADIARVEGREVQAQVHLSSAAQLAEKVGVASRQAYFLGLLAESYWATGDVALAIDALEQGARAAKGLTLSHAFFLLHLGSIEEASEWLERFAEAEPDPLRRAAATLGLARARWWGGEIGEARRLCAELRRFLAPTPVPRVTLCAMLLESCVNGEGPRALALLEQAGARCAPYERAELTLDLATQLAQSPTEPAIARRFLEISGDTRHRGIAYRVEALRSDLFAAIDRNEDARVALARARQELEWLTGSLSGEYLERLQESRWLEALERLRSVP